MRSFNDPVFAAVTNTGTVTSIAIDASYLISATVQAKFTDVAAAGTLKLQASNDNALPTNWNDIPNSSATVASGALTTTPPIAAPFSYRWIRAVFVSSGGAGTINGVMQGIGY